jgi:hypothetical protein
MRSSDSYMVAHLARRAFGEVVQEGVLSFVAMIALGPNIRNAWSQWSDQVRASLGSWDVAQ